MRAPATLPLKTPEQTPDFRDSARLIVATPELEPASTGDA
jgi:hypothetical protein